MLLVSFYMDYKKVFELVAREDNAKNTKNAVIQGKYKKYSVFVTNAKSAKIAGTIYFFYIFKN